MEGILGAFQSTFPSLYVPEREPEEKDPRAEANVQGQAGARVQAGAAPKAKGDAEGGEGEAPAPEPSPEPDQYTQKIQKITNKFEQMRTSANELEEYLHTAEAQAKDAEFRALAKADEDFTPAWRHTGLPMKPSHLRLDQGRMEGGRLVNPKAIMGQYQELQTKEVLLPPRIYEYNDTSIEPNYLKMTGTLISRNSMIPAEKLERVKEASLKTRTWHELTDDEVKQKIQESDNRRKKQDSKMPAAQYEAEKKVIKSMNQKLSFLRNPRYPLPPAVKMLQSQFKDPNAKMPPIKANMTAHPENVFEAEPGVVTFTDYAVGEVYSRRVRIRNVTNVARSLRCFPPASQYFHMSLLRFPQDKGIVAPGMAAEVTIRFTPDSLADYDDHFAVDTAMARFLVPIEARRPPPSLDLPPEINVGEVLAGNKKVLSVNFSNAGGASRFRIIPESYWPKEYAHAPAEIAQVGPFQVWPLYFDMQPGDEVALSLSYEPLSVGVHEERLLIVCDNCQVNSFLLRGTATNVDIVVNSIDGQRVKPGTQPALPIWFGEVVPESGFTRNVTVSNTTTLPFPFKWSMYSYPQTRPEVRFNEPLGDGMMASTGDLTDLFESASCDYGAQKNGTSMGAGTGKGVSNGTVDGSTLPAIQPGAGGYGKVDMVGLGEASEREISVFYVEPAEGVLQPGEDLDFRITFVPSRCGRVERWATLRVDRSTPGTPAQGCNVNVLEIGLEGVGRPLVLDISPRRVIVPGKLTPGHVEIQNIVVSNPTRAPAIFNFTNADTNGRELVQVRPSSGTIQPLQSVMMQMALTAPQEPGPHLTGMMLNVAHGPSQLVEMSATVAPPCADFISSALSFGLVRLNDTSTLPLKIVNTSKTCPTRWSLREICDVDEEAEAETGPEAAEAALREGLTPEASGAMEAEAGSAAAAAAKPSPKPRTHVAFSVDSGILRPGETTVVHAVLHALSDGAYSSTIQLIAPGSRPCIPCTAAVVTPRVAISTPIIDLGHSYLGVTVKKNIQIRNLSLLPLQYDFSVETPLEDPRADLKIRPSSGSLQPGELQDIQVRYTPKSIGHSIMMGVCDMVGAKDPAGFVISSDIRPLDVMYQLLSEEEYKRYKANLASGKKKRYDVENFEGMTHLPPDVLHKISISRSPGSEPTPFPPGNQHWVANFGENVPLGEARNQYLIITNRTPIHTTVHCWLDYFGIEDASKLTKKPRVTAGKGDTSGTYIKSSKYTPIKLSDEAEKTKPFRSDVGNDMMATRRLQEDSEQVLGAKGLAVNVSPPSSTLGPWSRLEMQVTCFNDMCGDYYDLLHVQVGDCPVKEIPVRIGVAGTPLVVQRDRVLIKGLRARTWRTDLAFGEIPVGIELDKTFYVFNTGGLDMQLDWEFRRFQDESDFNRPDAKVLDLDCRIEEPPPKLDKRETEDSGFPSHPNGFGHDPVAKGAESAAGDGEKAGGEVVKGGGAQDRAPPPAVAEQAAEGAAVTPTEGEGATGESGEAVESDTRTTERPKTPEPEWNGKIHLKLATHAEPDVAPYVVEPASKILKGGESAMFTVKFVSDRSVAHQGYLHGTQKVFAPECPMELKVWPSGDQAEDVGVMFTRTFHPYAGFPPSALQPLRVDLESTGVTSRLDPDNEKELQFVCHSVHKPSTHRSYKSIITMSNRQTCPLIFDLRTEGPFQLLSATPSCPQDPISYMGTTGTMANFAGKTYLPAKETVDVEIQFLPAKAAESNYMDYNLSGELVANFANGDVQVLPLTASVLHPQMEVKPTMLEYGRVHVQSPKPIVVTLANHSEVDAYWSVIAADDQSSKPKYFVRPEELAPGGAASQSEARFGAFIVQPAGGLLKGRGLGMPRTLPVTVTFAPTDAKDFDQKIKFAVSKGRTCTLSMKGTGSFDERDEHKAKLFGI